MVPLGEKLSLYRWSTTQSFPGNAPHSDTDTDSDTDSDTVSVSVSDSVSDSDSVSVSVSVSVTISGYGYRIRPPLPRIDGSPPWPRAAR
jgi:hypothetical protein